MALTAAPTLVVAGPQVRCTVADRRLAELSGLVVDAGGLWALPDGGRRVEVYRLDPGDCAVTGVRTGAVDPFDGEDLARGPDGELWVADIGDNDRRRSTVAVIVLPARGGAQLRRLTYPDGPHDAEALLVAAGGVPFVVTKEVGRSAGIYRTEKPPAGTGPTPLVRVGEVDLPLSDTPGGPIGGLGSRMVTGAAATADGHVVALRTYTDAWLYLMSGGDVAGALAGAPVRLPLPDEPQGEAIAFGPDGTLFSGSETRGGQLGEIRAVPGAAGLVDAAVIRPGPPVAGSGPPATGTGPPAGKAPVGGAAAVEGAASTWLPAAIGGVAAVGLLALVGAALGIRARRSGRG